MKNKIYWLIAIAIILVAGALFFGSLKSTDLLWQLSNGGKLLLPLVIVAALVDSVNPCAFSILLLTIAFLFSLGQVRSSILKTGGFYVAGLFLIYILIGLGILGTLHIFNTPHFMAKIGASLLILLGGINIINEFFPAFPVKLKIPAGAHRKMAELVEKGSAPAAFVLGGLVGLCEFPCTGGPYLMVLGLLHDQATYLKGLGYLIFYNLIFVMPLVIILFIAGDKKVLEKVQNWQQKEKGMMRLWSGVIMIALGLIIFLF
ncbi:MAG: cytochrome c biogenesis protein CcdA [bacterium]|nr:cytochrome c biogenesis protein CcdA [bacterium]